VSGGPRLYNYEIRAAFAVFSKAHDLLDLRTGTLFQAFEIYCRYRAKVKIVDTEVFYCVCLFLAIKWDEVKPCTLTQVQKRMGWDILKKDYIYV
jgi:hypothetical protein